MRERFPLAEHDEPVREVGLIMAREDLDLVPIVDDDGALAGVMTERALARRYIRESREASELDAPTAVGAIAEVLEGELLAGEPDDEVDAAACGCWRWTTASLPIGFERGRRGRGRRPPRRAADRDRASASRCSSLSNGTAAEPDESSRWRASAAPRSSPRRSTAT